MPTAPLMVGSLTAGPGDRGEPALRTAPRRPSVGGPHHPIDSERTEYWVDHCRVRLKPVAAIYVFEVRASPSVRSEQPWTIARHNPHYGKAEFVLGGRMVVSQDGRQAVVEAGDIAIHNAIRPFEMVATDDFRMVGVVFPRCMIPAAHGGLPGLTATRMDGRWGSGALLASYLTALSSKFDSILPQEEAGISSAVGGLLTATCAQLAPDGAAMGAESPKSVLVTRIRRFVDAGVADPGLNPAGIAAAHHISIRQLHRLFEHEDMTVTELIRTRRLEGCKHDLADPALRDQPIGAIASRWGIPDSAKFSRIFRAAYGASPREYRNHADGGAGR